MSSEWLAGGDPRLTPSTDLTAARDLVAMVPDGDPVVEEHRGRILGLIDSTPELARRAARPGHLTGSTLVVDADGERVLVLHHRKLDIWVQPGGHADGDANLAGVAWREATEETGIAGLLIAADPIDLDIHRVSPPGEDAHDHLDVRFVAIAPTNAVAVTNHESRDSRWVRPEELAALGADAGLIRLAVRGIGRVRSGAAPLPTRRSG